MKNLSYIDYCTIMYDLGNLYLKHLFSDPLGGGDYVPPFCKEHSTFLQAGAALCPTFSQ